MASWPKKGPPTGREKKRAAYRALRPAVRAAAFGKDDGRCVWPTCRRAVLLETDNEFRLAHAHEIVNRSLGGDPTEIDEVVTTCFRCHSELHVRVGGKRKRIEGTRTTGLKFFERVRGEWEEVSK